MKNSFTLALLLLCGGTLHAQLNKGTQLLTGSFNIGAGNQESSNNNETLKNNNFGAGIGVGRQWVHKENRIRGFQIGYNYNSNTQNYQSVAGETKRTSNTFNVGYVSQYLLPFGKKFYGTATILSQFAFSKQKEQYENNNNFATNGENYGLSVGIQPGLAYQLNKRWIADVTLGNLVGANLNHSRYRSTSTTTNFKDRSTSFNLNSMFSGNSTYLGIGFRYILR
ncbi:MAG: hypothetical protein LCH58_01705 [Bacteroidetes bacterium]|uniref:hypothetical protein n=1 Tax=Phnomibacter sp. TaxID=2836217 RepID=UPI002FDC9C5C|nr:hypothetical protein [Bacteroidota bacterium]